MKKNIYICLILCIGWMSFVNAQAIVLDELVKAGDLTLFPSIYNQNEYYYLSDQVRLAKDDNGKPQFSFLRWVENQSTTTEDNYKDTEGAGGGIVTALVELKVSDEQKQEAEQELRRINPRGKIKGPVMYRGGTVALVSAFNAENEEFSQQVLGLGPAPVLDGQKASVSIQLTKKGSKILWESFKTNTPNIVFKFNMEIEGYNSPIKAKVNFKWEKIYEHKNFQAGVATPVLSAEIDAAMDEMMENNTISITEIGEDEDFDEIRNMVMEIVRTEMFESQENSTTPSLSELTSGSGSRPSMLDRATALLNQQRQDYNNQVRAANIASSNTPTPRSPNNSNTTSGTEDNDDHEDTADNESDDIEPRAGTAVRRASPEDEPSTVPPYQPRETNEPQAPSIAIAAAFRFKSVKKTGTFNLNMEKSLPRNQVINFDEGIGRIKCKDCFHMVNLDDPLYKQREIVAFVDGFNTDDFGQFVNFVSVLLKKKHENGQITQREIRIDRNNFSNGNLFKFDPYGWKGDKNRGKWLEYDYKTTWSFFGGHEVSTPWSKREAGSIALAPPFQKKDVYIEIDDTLKEDYQVRFAEVKLYYPQGEKEKVERIRIDLNKDELSKRIGIIQADDQLQYEYEVKWHIKGRSPITQARTATSDETIFLSDIGQF